MPDEPTLDALAERIGILERKQTRLEISSYVKYGIMLALVVVAAAFGRDQAHDIRAVANDNAALALRTNTALCSLRADLQRRVDSSRDFLKNNPDGIPGIPAAVLKQSQDNQQRTIDSLVDLDCKDA